MIAPLPPSLSEHLFAITTEEELADWLGEVEKAIFGLTWHPLGGIENNVHTVEVASDPALALVERPTNGIDALLDLRARERGQTAATPHEAARKWWRVPAGGLAAMSGDRERERERRELADLIRVTMHESGDQDRPTIVVQDQGTGQHPEDFPRTLLSLLASNKKGANHQMGVYNAGGAASFKFAKATVIASRLAPTLRQGRSDELGVTVVRYDPLDPEKFKSGVYQYMAGRDGSIVRLGIRELPGGLPFGTYIKLLEYLVPKYARAAYEPKRSLWQLFHAALPDPALPIRIIETRAGQFPGVRGEQERRVVAGLQNLLGRTGTSIHSDERELTLDEATGKVILRYYVLNDSVDPDAYTTSEQSLTITLNGQRQVTKDRQWLRRNLELFYLYKRLVVIVDATRLTSAAKRQVFSSTRETGVDTPVTKTILDRVIQDLVEDEELDRLEELAKQRALQDATETTTEKIKRQLAGQIAAFLKGDLSGREGGGLGRRKKRRRRRPGEPRDHDDSLMLEVPDKLTFVTDPVRVERGGTASFSLAINTKNGFLPRYADGLSIVFGPELAGQVKVISRGSLLGGRVRIMLEATPATPIVVSSVRVALVVPELGLLLTNEGIVEIREPQEDRRRQRDTGGRPDIRVLWVGREKWDQFEPPWDAETVGSCNIYRDDPTTPKAITKVEWVLNEAFLPFEQVVAHKRIGEQQMKTFRDGYAYPVLFALFRQRLAEEKKESEADEEGKPINIPPDYIKAEHARTARAVLMAMEPEVTLAEAAED